MRKICLLLLLCACSLQAQKKKIQPSQLPEKALTFIETNFSSVALRQCMQFTEGDNIRYKAVLADDTEIDLTESGDWTEIDGKVHSIQPTFLGPAVIDQIRKAQPGHRLLKATKTAKSIDVTLVNGAKLSFDLNGKLK
ncbi:MAG: hypothetical protein EOO50_04170 [Flavobacterium sp.]|uniref:PepSY-like domain-containing protein n=1 Tax=Flavobacterium sp. TaxID=239 RepID=UPI001218FB72|nr:PepSY-like domain-containing protein [Flavobacterium sp.]RZJ67778.1 MAG: hypothetical protein EOO50_04170 [Flavobacterium sp.]